MSTGTVIPLGEALAAFPGLDLDTVNRVAGLLERTDRKYLVPLDLLARVLADLPSATTVLEIDGSWVFGYESVYFDTPALTSFRLAAHHRPQRFKVRTRCYLDTGATFLEAKTKDRRGATHKARIPVDRADHGRLDADGRRFLASIPAVARSVETLAPVLTTTYRRATLVFPAHHSRCTIDLDLWCTATDGSSTTVAGAAVVETKSGAEPTPMDRVLWAHHVRPARVSKYATALAVLDDHLPSNRWHRATQWFTPADGSRRALG